MKRWGLTIVLLLAAHALRADEPPAAATTPLPSPPTLSKKPRSVAGTPEQRAQALRARDLVRQMDDLYQVGNSAQALPLAEEFVTICRGLKGPRSAEVAYGLHQVAYFNYVLGNHEKSVEVNRQALAIRREVLGGDHVHTALSLCNLADALIGLGQLDEAVACRQEALAIHRKKDGAENGEVARLLDELADAYAEKRNSQAAEEHYRQALAMRQKLFGDADPQTCHTLHGLGSFLYQEGRYAEARNFLEQALAIGKALKGEKSPDTQATLILLAETCGGAGDFNAAHLHFERALALRQEAVGQDHPDVADLHWRLGATWLMEGNYAQAKDCYLKSLASYQRARGDDSAKAISLVVELGNLHARMADQAAARRYFETALAVIGRKSGMDSADTLPARIPLAACLDSLGDRRAAWHQFQEAEAIARRQLPLLHADTAYLCHELGGFLNGLGMHAKAHEFLDRALAIREQLLGTTHPRTANTLEALAGTCALEQNYPNALNYARRTLGVRNLTLPKEHPDLARSYNDLGYLMGCTGDFDKAVTYLQKSVAMSRKSLGDSHPAVAAGLSNLAVYTLAVGDSERAGKLADASRKAVRRHVAEALPMLPERDQLNYLATSDGVLLDQALSLGVRAGSEPRMAELSAGWLLNSKGLAQEVLAERVAAVRASGDERLQSIAQRLRRVRAQQSRLVLSTLDVEGAPATSAARGALAEEEERLSRQLAQAMDSAAQTDRWVELADVRARLSPREVFVNIARFRLRDLDAKAPGVDTGVEHYVAWVIPAAGQGDVRIVDLGEVAAIDPLVMALRVAVQSIYRVNEETGQITAVDDEAARLFDGAFWRLSQTLLHPLVKQLGEASELTISPDATLWLVPWHALLLEDGRFAVERYLVRHLVSGRELVTPEQEQSTARPMIVASPDFDLDPSTAEQITQAVLSKGTISAGSQIAATTVHRPTGKRLATPLPGFEQQVKLVTPHLAQFAGKKPGVFQGKYALEGLIKSVHHPQVMLFATHGFYEPALAMTVEERRALEAATAMSGAAPLVERVIDNPLLQCGVLLAGCNQRHDEGEDGVLTGMEIVGIDLRGTELIVLSACDTGVGAVYVGEGVAGVRQAFHLAGAKAVVATLWPVVVHESTQEMSDFFQNLAAGQSKAQALRGAQLSAIARMKKDHGGAPPLLWAAFTLTGK